jgi:hypothetical protein
VLTVMLAEEYCAGRPRLAGAGFGQGRAEDRAPAFDLAVSRQGARPSGDRTSSTGSGQPRRPVR